MASAGEMERRLVKSAMSAPYLERRQEHDLACRWREQGDERALHELTAAHMRLVVAMAGRFRRYGLSLADLIQEGHVGLLEAAKRFEPARDIRFSTYASWWIRASMQDFILRNWSIVRGGTSSSQKALFFKLRQLRARLARAFPDEGPQQAYGRIAADLGVSPGDVAAMDARLSGVDLSLNAPVTESGDDGAPTRGDRLVDDAPLPDDIVAERIDSERRRASLRRALATLNERELRIVAARRLREEAATLETLGARLGISKERVRQIEARALDKLRRFLCDPSQGLGVAPSA